MTAQGQQYNSPSAVTVAGTKGAQSAAKGRQRDRWTPEFLGFVLPLSADQVLGAWPDPARCREWAWISTAQRLVQTYGAEEAVRRLNALCDGSDLDLQGWRSIGLPKAA